MMKVILLKNKACKLPHLKYINTIKMDHLKVQRVCFIQCVRKVAVHLQKVLEVMSTSVYIGLNTN
jgi:hypothetical protein